MPPRSKQTSPSKTYQASQGSNDGFWEVERIIREHPTKRRWYEVEWAGIDPATDRRWTPSFVPRKDITADLLEDWDARKAERQKRKRKSTMAKNSTSSNISTRRSSRSDTKTDSGSIRTRSRSTRGRSRTEEHAKDEEDQEDDDDSATYTYPLRQPSTKRKVQSIAHSKEEDDQDMDVDDEAPPRHAHSRRSSPKRRVSFSLKRAESPSERSSIPAEVNDEEDARNSEGKEDDEDKEGEQDEEVEQDEDVQEDGDVQEDDDDEEESDQERDDDQEEDNYSDDALLKPIPMRKSSGGLRTSPTISDLGVGHHKDAAPNNNATEEEDAPGCIEPSTRDGPLVWDFSQGEAVSVSQRAGSQQFSASRQASAEPLMAEDNHPVTRIASERRSLSNEPSVFQQQSPRQSPARVSSPSLLAAGAKRKRAADDDAGQPPKRVHIEEDASDNESSNVRRPAENALAGPSSLMPGPSIPNGQQATNNAQPLSQETEIVEDSLERIERDPDDGDEDDGAGDQPPSPPRDERDDEEEEQSGSKPLIIYDAPSSPRELDPWLPWPRAEKLEEQEDFNLPSRSPSTELQLDRKEKKRRKELWKMVHRVRKWERDIDKEGRSVGEGVPTTPKYRRQRAPNEDQDGDVDLAGDNPDVPLVLDNASNNRQLSEVSRPSSAAEGASEAEEDFYHDVFYDRIGIDDKDKEAEEPSADMEVNERSKPLGPIPRDIWTEQSMLKVHRSQQERDQPEDINDTFSSQQFKQDEKDDIEAFTSPVKGTQMSRFSPSQEGEPSLGNASLGNPSVPSAPLSAVNPIVFSLQGRPPIFNVRLDDRHEYNVEDSPPTLRYPDEEEDAVLPEPNLDDPTRSGLIASANPPVTPAHVTARSASPQPPVGPSAPVTLKAIVQDPNSQDTTSSGDLSLIGRAPEQPQRMEEEESSRDLEEEMRQREREQEAAEEARRLLEREEAEARQARQDERAREERRMFELEEQEQIELERIAERQRERRNRENKDAANKLRASQLIGRNDDENMDVDSIPPVAGPSVPPLVTPTVDAACAPSHFSATLSVVEPGIVPNHTTRVGSDSSGSLPANSSSPMTTEEDLPNDVDQLKALVRELRAAPRSHDSEIIADPSQEDINALQAANASLLQDKIALTEERDFFRGHYEAQSALANDLIKEKRMWEAERTRLQSEVQIAKGQAKDGVALIRATYEGTIEWLKNDAAKWRDQVTFMRDVDLRTNGPGVRADELRRRAAEYPNLEVELQRVKTQLVEERASGKERDRAVQRALAEREVLQQQLDQEREVKEQKVRENEQILLALETARQAYEQSRTNAGPGSQQPSDGQMTSEASPTSITNAEANALAGGASSVGPNGSQGAYFCEMDDVGFSTMDGLKQHIAEAHALYETAPMAT